MQRLEIDTTAEVCGAFVQTEMFELKARVVRDLSDDLFYFIHNMLKVGPCETPS